MHGWLIVGDIELYIYMCLYIHVSIYTCVYLYTPTFLQTIFASLRSEIILIDHSNSLVCLKLSVFQVFERQPFKV